MLKKLLAPVVLFIFCLPLIAFAQSPAPKINWMVKDPFEQKVFIENKGQFNGKDKQKDSRILYGFDNMGVYMFFTDKGFTAKLEQMEVFEQEEHGGIMSRAAGLFGKKEKEEEIEIKRYEDFLNMEWVGANLSAKVIVEDMVHDYYNYDIDGNPAHQVSFARAYKKLIYKDIYPKIDLEYVFHAGQGVKYTLTLRPGADPSQIKMRYSSHNNIVKKSNGDIRIQMKMGSVTDAAPITHYLNSKTQVLSSFSLNGDVVSFQLGNYDPSKTVVIDPTWNVNPAFTTTNKAFDVEPDNNGNVWAYGGSSNWKLKRFNNAGVVQWTYSNPNTPMYGDFDVVGKTGVAYITTGLQGTITKVRSNGTMAFNNTTICNYEYWTVNIDCSGNRVVVSASFGNGGQTAGLANIDTTTGACTGLVNFTTGGSNPDLRACVWAPNGNFYLIQTRINQVNELWARTSAFAPVYTGLAGFNCPYNGTPLYAVSFIQPYNGLDADNTNLWMTSGLQLFKKNIGTGATLTTINIPGGGLMTCNGVAVDACGTVFAGSANGVYKFDNNLVQLSTQATPAVYDVTLAPNGDVLACGNAFVASMNFNACPPPLQLLTVTTSSNAALCANNNGSATASGSNGTNPYTYSWSNGMTGATISGLSAGIYTVTVQDAGCKNNTQTVQVTTSGASLVLNTSQVNVLCNGGVTGTASITATGGTGTMTYVWNPGGQSAQGATGLSAGTYTVTATDQTGCSSTTTVLITQPTAITSSTAMTAATCTQGGTASATGGGGTGGFNYSWNPSGQLTQTATGLSQGTYTVTVTDANNCTKTDTITVTGILGPVAGISNTSNVSCFGGSNGVAMVTTSGGTGTMTYAWNNGQTAANATALSAGNYTVTVTDGNGCTVTLTVGITQPTQLVATATGVNACVNATANGNAVGGTANYNYLWSNGQATQNATGLSSGTYTLVVTDANGCTATDTATVAASTPPNVVFNVNDTAGCVALCVTFKCITGNISTYTWDFGDGSANFNGVVDSANHCYKQPGTFTVKLTVTDNNGCTGTYTYINMIYVYPNVVAGFTASPQPTTILNPIITFTDMSLNGASTWNWSFGDLLNSTSTLQNPTFNYKDSGCYKVELISNNPFNCPDTTSQQICIGGDYELFAPNAFTPDGNGLNDIFLPRGIGIDPENFHMWIFDRWGNLIYETTDLLLGWNGHANGGKDIAQQDVYVWKVATRDFLGGKHSYIGHVSLVR